jgi:hypothetical protein
MLAAKRASRKMTATPLRIKTVAIVTFFASFRCWVVLTPDTLPGVMSLAPSRRNLGDA